MTNTATVDMSKTEAGMNLVMGNLAGALITSMCSIGDRLGLFTDLAERAQPQVKSWRRAPASVNAMHESG